MNTTKSATLVENGKLSFENLVICVRVCMHACMCVCCRLLTFKLQGLLMSQCLAQVKCLYLKYWFHWGYLWL